MPETAHPLMTFPVKPPCLGIGISQYGLNTNRCFASTKDNPRLNLKLRGFSSFSKEAPWSIALLNVYANEKYNPWEKCFSSCTCNALYAEFAIVSSAKMLLNTGTPSAGHPLPVNGWHSGEENGRKPTSVTPAGPSFVPAGIVSPPLPALYGSGNATGNTVPPGMVYVASEPNCPQVPSPDYLIQRQARRRIPDIQVVRSEQTMALCPHVSHAQNHVLCELALEGQIVLVRNIVSAGAAEILRTTASDEIRAIHATRASRGTKTRRARSLFDDAGERIWSVPPRLELERKIKKRAGQERAASKRRLCAELLQHKLFDGVVEHSPSHAHARLPRTAGKFRKPSFRPSGTPRQPDAGCKRLVLRLRQTSWHPRVPRKLQAQRKNRVFAAPFGPQSALP